MITKFNFKDRAIKSYAIRKLTPKECFRLMGVRDGVIAVMQSTVAQVKKMCGKWRFPKHNDDSQMAVSASQQYKQAGNSIVVDVLRDIYSNLIYPPAPKRKAQMSMFDVFFAEDVLPGLPPKPYWDGDEFCIITTFSGYDSQLMAADALKEIHPQFRWTCEGWSDIDKYACQMHDIVFPQFADKAMGDITKIDWHAVKERLNGREVDLFTYSSPCQDISQAGKQMGLKEGSGSRSALLWNVADAIEVLRPKYLLQENVAALVSEKFMPDFKLWLKKLESLGYVNKWALINAKDHNCPQNRLRVFCLSMRKDCAFEYQFPDSVPLTKCLEDVLEDEVDERFFLKDKDVDKFLKANDKDDAVFVEFDIPPTHEDAMFLKTWCEGAVAQQSAWDTMSPTELEKYIRECSPRFYEIHHHWKHHGFNRKAWKWNDIDLFKERFKENMKKPYE